jgi:hypothetical protein
MSGFFLQFDFYFGTLNYTEIFPGAVPSHYERGRFYA